MITSGSIPKALQGDDEADHIKSVNKVKNMAHKFLNEANMKNSSCQDCDDHHSYFAPRKHPDHGKKVDRHLAEHQRGAGHPADHTPGKMPSQLAPDHGPHR